MDPNGRNKVIVESHVNDFDFKGFASPDWLPDGRLVYARNGEVHGSSDWSGVWPSITGGSPAVSPDGESVAFVSTGDIHVLNVDGSNEHVITTGKEPAWSPDGSRLAIAVGTGIYIVNSDGTDLHLVVDKGSNPDWSPDGSRIVFERYFSSENGILTVNPDGSEEGYLTSHPDTDPAWSPDGKKIAFVRDGSIFVMNSDGGNTKRLTGSGRCGED
jgi:TolB protein